MARLRREWGVQVRTIAGDWSTDVGWAIDRQAAYSGADALYPTGEARVVSRVVSDWGPDDPTPPPFMVCPVDGGRITTSQGRHAPMCVKAVCRYEGPGVPRG